MNKNHKPQTTLTLIATLALGWAMPAGVLPAEANEFVTDEYYGVNGRWWVQSPYDFMNLSDTYAKGYTGKGVTVGVIDDNINPYIPDFIDQDVQIVQPTDDEALPGDMDLRIHGTMVSGIIMADKNDFGMHGVAFDAGLAFAAYGNFTNDHWYTGFLDDDNIKLINNSWRTVVHYTDSGTAYDTLHTFSDNNSWYQEAVAAARRDKLLVFSAGNHGQAISTSLQVHAGSDEALRNHIVNVTSASHFYLAEQDDGSILASVGALSLFTNLSAYAEDYSLSAFGTTIYGPDALEIGETIYRDGTSFATPMATGVGALVQQAYPYLSGKQIGDVLLSTANKNIKLSDSDNGFVTLSFRPNRSSLEGLSVYLVDGAEGETQKQEAAYALIRKAYNQEYQSDDGSLKVLLKDEFDWHMKDVYGDTYDCSNGKEFADYIRKLVDKETLKLNIYTDVPMDVLFGQGVVDADKATNGLGAINVRRLTKDDVSGDYTVYGEQKDQALYTVDTQGYDSVWSNDIGEIRAGYIAENPLGDENTAFDGADGDIKDLHDRWVYYTENFDLDSTDGTVSFADRYVEDYNKYVKVNGLLGLQGGLKKTGDGTLALTGKNTYKGATIAAGGTLQIDGSVAGDAYSEDAGAIAGSGTINGNLYNNGAVAAGSWGAVTKDDGTAQTLNVKGTFDGKGRIIANTDGTTYARLHVKKNADLSQMTLQAGQYAAPDVTGTILTSGGAMTGADSLNGSFSGLLDSEVRQDGDSLNLTTKADNNAGIAADRFAAVNGLYSALDKDEQKDMYRLYALDSGNVRTAIDSLSRSESMHLELAYDAMQNRDVRQAVRQQERTNRDESVWAITGKGWGNMDDGLKRHSWNTTVGYDFYDDGDIYAGALVAYSDNSLSGYDADGTYKNYSVGLYGGTKNRPGTVTAYMSYGRQENELTRYLGSSFSYDGAASKATSDYDSTVFGVGATYAYDLQYGREDAWHVSPYVGIDYAHYKQDSFREDGSVYSLSSDGFSDDYLAGEIGVDMKRETNDKTYGLSVAYRRVFDGDVQHTGFSYAKGKGPGFGVQSMNRSKDHVIASAYASAKLSDRWEIGGAVEQDWSHTSRDLSAAVNVAYRF